MDILKISCIFCSKLKFKAVCKILIYEKSNWNSAPPPWAQRPAEWVCISSVAESVTGDKAQKIRLPVFHHRSFTGRSSVLCLSQKENVPPKSTDKAEGDFSDFSAGPIDTQDLKSQRGQQARSLFYFALGDPIGLEKLPSNWTQKGNQQFTKGNRHQSSPWNSPEASTGQCRAPFKRTWDQPLKTSLLVGPLSFPDQPGSLKLFPDTRVLKTLRPPEDQRPAALSVPGRASTLGPRRGMPLGPTAPEQPSRVVSQDAAEGPAQRSIGGVPGPSPGLPHPLVPTLEKNPLWTCLKRPQAPWMPPATRTWPWPAQERLQGPHTPVLRGRTVARPLALWGVSPSGWSLACRRPPAKGPQPLEVREGPGVHKPLRRRGGRERPPRRQARVASSLSMSPMAWAGTSQTTQTVTRPQTVERPAPEHLQRRPGLRRPCVWAGRCAQMTHLGQGPQQEHQEWGGRGWGWGGGPQALQGVSAPLAVQAVSHRLHPPTSRPTEEENKERTMDLSREQFWDPMEVLGTGDSGGLPGAV